MMYACSEDLIFSFPIQVNHQPDATIFQFIILTFICSAVFVVRPVITGYNRPDHEHSTTVITIRR